MFSPNSPPVRTALKRVTDVLEVRPFQKPADAELRTVFLCMTPRSGSSYLGSALFANGVARFGEHFRTVGGSLEKAVEKSGGQSFEDYVLGVQSEMKNKKLFGVKLDWLQFAPLYYLGAYDHLFTGAKFVYLTRNDVLSQAISRYIATETGYFHSVNKDRENTRDQEIEFNYDKLWSHVEHLVAMQSAWEAFFATEGLMPLRISYEEVDSDPESVVRRIGTYCDLKLPETLVIDTNYKRVRNVRNERIRDLAIAEARRRRQQIIPTFNTANETRAAG
jgi:LPS sulfotransferase NodH